MCLDSQKASDEVPHKSLSKTLSHHGEEAKCYHGPEMGGDRKSRIQWSISAQRMVNSKGCRFRTKSRVV